MHDITHYEYNVMLFKCDGRNRLAQGGAVSQLVMRSFDVSDKGEGNKREGPLGRRVERTPNLQSNGKKKAIKRRKVWAEAGSHATLPGQPINSSAWEKSDCSLCCVTQK